MSKRKKKYAVDVLKREIEARKMKLKPCPFCGGQAHVSRCADDCRYSAIYCESCGLVAKWYHDYEDEAIKAWNARVDVANNLLKTEQINPEISLDGIHPDLINGLLEAKRNSSEFPNSSKELMEFIKFCRNASATEIRQIHDRARDLIANYKECCKKSCKEENATLKPLVPKWADIGGGRYYLKVPIMQAVKMIFEIKYDTEENPLLYTLNAFFTVWDSECDYEEEIGYFNDLEGAKAKANECIKELGERLVYFSNNIKTEKDK